MAETVALVAGESLLGREVRDTLGESGTDFSVRLIAAPDEEEGKLTEAAGTFAVSVKLERSALQDIDATVLACTPELALQVAALGSGGTLIDLSYALEERENARLRAPVVEPHDFRVAHDAIQVVAHPAAVALALVLGRIHPVFAIERSVVQVFEPASERGRGGMEEMQGQAVNLLSFKPLPTAVYDTQVSYVLLPRWGEEAPVQLEEIEARIERHLATLLANGSGAPVPSLRLIQAPVFHGYSFSLWIEFAERPSLAALEQVLDESPIDVRQAATEPPNNVGVAGQSGVTVGAAILDRNNSRALWLWMAADNLKLMADTALDILREVL